MSHGVQMWWYSLQGLRNDLWSVAPPKMARKVLAGVFDQSLGIFVTRLADLDLDLQCKVFTIQHTKKGT